MKLGAAIPVDLRRRLRLAAVQLEEPIQDIVAVAIARELDRRGFSASD